MNLAVGMKMFGSVSSELGEGPVWIGRENSIYWVDIKGKKLHSKHWPDGVVQTKQFTSQISCIVPRARGGFVLALGDGLAFWDAGSDRLEIFAHPERDLPGNRYNDGACDHQGRFWIGSMDVGEREASGGVYRVDADLSVHKILDGYVVSNGLGWSLDDRHMYVTDSANREILIFDFDPVAGIPTHPRVFARVREDEGFPDGLTVDADGFVWSAHWDGARLTRYAPDGEVNMIVPMPVARPTSCMYGGPDLEHLFVTTAQGADIPGSSKSSGGELYVLHFGARGREEPDFAG